VLCGWPTKINWDETTHYKRTYGGGNANGRSLPHTQTDVR